MGLLELLQQGQTTLSAGSFPGDTPINDPQSGFIQENSPDNTYEDGIVGQPNNGSVLANTLGNTALDNTQPLFDTSTLPPPVNTIYPSLASGEFNGAPSQYNSPYGPGNTYLNQINSPEFGGIQSSSLQDSGLSSNTNNAAETTFIVPLPDIITEYPSENVTGIIGGAPQPYNQLWGETKPYYNYMKTNFEAH